MVFMRITVPLAAALAKRTVADVEPGVAVVFAPRIVDSAAILGFDIFAP
jgi:hypothetical protein